MVDDETLEFLDIFEEVPQNFYSKKKILVKGEANGDIHDVFCYVLEDFKSYLIENNNYFLDNYDSNNNNLNLSYIKHADTLDRVENLIEQVKNLPKY